MNVPYYFVGADMCDESRRLAIEHHISCAVQAIIVIVIGVGRLRFFITRMVNALLLHRRVLCSLGVRHLGTRLVGECGILW